MKTSLFIILVLVGTMILEIPIQSYADPQLDTLLRIANQAKENLRITMSQITNMPVEISQLYKQGSNETDELAKAVDQQDVDSAKQHFLSAMKFFKTINDKINSLNETASNDQQHTNVIQIQSEIMRMNKIGNSLKTIAEKNHIDIDFTKFDQLIQTAKQDLDEGNISDASQTIQAANQFVVDTHHSLATIASKKTSDRAKDFTEKQIERFNRISELNAPQNVRTAAPSMTATVTNNSSTVAEENPQEMIAKLREMISEGKIDDAIKMIKSIEAYQKVKLQTKEKSEESVPANTIAINSTAINPPSVSANTTAINSTAINPPSVPSNETATNSTAINPPSVPSNETATKSTEVNKTNSLPLTNPDKVGSGQDNHEKRPPHKNHETKDKENRNHEESGHQRNDQQNPNNSDKIRINNLN